MTSRRFRAAPSGSLHLTALGDLVAIYDRRAGQTHIVASPVPEILAAIGEDDCDADALMARLATDFDFVVDGDARVVMAERLTELAALGLVEAL